MPSACDFVSIMNESMIRHLVVFASLPDVLQQVANKFRPSWSR